MRTREQYAADLEKRVESLSAELELKNEMLSALKHTVVSTIGGTDYEGFPTSEINYLQRLRILVEKESQLADERKHSDELLKCLHLMRCTIGEAYEHWDADRDSKTGKLLMSLGGGLPGYRADIDAIHETIKESAERRKA